MEMGTILFLLHAISCCWLASATLSKTDAKKPHKSEAEVSKFRVLPAGGWELCVLTAYFLFYSGMSAHTDAPILNCPVIMMVISQWNRLFSCWSLYLDFSSWVVCIGERPCGVGPTLERHSEGGKETLCAYQEDFSRTSTWICNTCRFIHSTASLLNCKISYHCFSRWPDYGTNLVQNTIIIILK